MDSPRTYARRSTLKLANKKTAPGPAPDLSEATSPLRRKAYKPPRVHPMGYMPHAPLLTRSHQQVRPGGHMTPLAPHTPLPRLPRVQSLRSLRFSISHFQISAFPVTSIRPIRPLRPIPHHAPRPTPHAPRIPHLFLNANRPELSKIPETAPMRTRSNTAALESGSAGERLNGVNASAWQAALDFDGAKRLQNPVYK